MKILMINKFLYPRGGAETYMLKLGQQLQKMGHVVEYFGMYDEKNTVGNTLGLCTTNMDFHATGPERFLYPFKIIYSTEAQRKLGKVMDQFQPDIVHMNNINFQLTPSIIYAVKKRNIPLVQTSHDYQMICPNHLLYSFRENKPCDRCVGGATGNCFKQSCIHGSRVKSLLGTMEAKLYAFLKTYQLVDLYVCPSHFLANKLLGSSGLYAGRTCTIHNFIERKIPAAKPLDQAPYIAFVGRLSKEKGVELLAQTAKLLPQYRFLVAGSGPDGDCLKDIPNVTMMGFLNGQELTDFMAHAHLLVFPSVCYENCPLSILEAHSMGVPVVTMNHGGMAELVQDGKTGCLVRESTPQALAAALETCMDERKYHILKTNCEATAESIMDVEEYCRFLVQKYDELKKKR